MVVREWVKRFSYRDSPASKQKKLHLKYSPLLLRIMYHVCDKSGKKFQWYEKFRFVGGKQVLQAQPANSYAQSNERFDGRRDKYVCQGQEFPSFLRDVLSVAIHKYIPRYECELDLYEERQRGTENAFNIFMSFKVKFLKRLGTDVFSEIRK